MSEKKTRSERREPNRMSDDELRDFVLGYCDGAIWTSEDVPRNLVGQVFMPLLLGDIRPLRRMRKLACVWADARRDKRTGMAVNGYPMFLSCALMHADDWARAVAAIAIERERRKTIAIPSAPASGTSEYTRQTRSTPPPPKAPASSGASKRSRAAKRTRPR